MSQYFHPQRQTKVINEGFACYTHNYIMNRLYDKGLVSEGSMLEFLKVNSGVIYQGNWEQSGAHLNPYKLGLSILNDIERICNAPTEEDYEWFPNITGSKNHLEIILDAVKNYRDESFIKQYLSPKVIRDMRLFHIVDEEHSSTYEVKNIHNQDGYREIRKMLAQKYEISRHDPDIQIVNANIQNSRILELVHYAVDDQLLVHDDAIRTLTHVKRLWGFDAKLTTVDKGGELLEVFTSNLSV
jgi:stage V sporulation protein R